MTELAPAGLLRGAVKTPPATPRDLSPVAAQGVRTILKIDKNNSFHWSHV